MKVQLICEKCGTIQTEETDGANLVVDFLQKHMFFMCMNKHCKHENRFDFGDWSQKSKASPLPRTRTV